MSSSDRVSELPSAVVSAASTEEEEVLHARSRQARLRRSAVAAVLGLIYFLKLVMITTLSSMLLAFVLEPLVGCFGRLRVPRAAGSLIAVLLMTFLAGALSYIFLNRAVDFASELPKYSGKIRATIGSIRSKTSTIEASTNSVVNPAPKNDQKTSPSRSRSDPAFPGSCRRLAVPL